MTSDCVITSLANSSIKSSFLSSKSLFVSFIDVFCTKSQIFCLSLIPKKMITLYLARHGQTEENIARIFQGHLPGTLTVEGVTQAEALRDTLQDIPLDAVVSSDLKRCVDTARIALEGRNLPWEKTILLREIDWGSWTGLAIKDVDLQHFPADVETEAMLYERAGRFVDYLKERYDGKRVLAVGHGLINRAVQAHIQGVTLEHLRSVPKMNNAELRRFQLCLANRC